MADSKYINPTDFIGNTIPTEVLEQLKVLGRVTFIPKPTSVSAVSTSGNEPDQGTVNNELQLSGVLDHVKGMEDLASQIEDMIDDLTKDMNIPVTNDTLKDAVKSLGGDGSAITREVFDKAQAIIDHTPILMNGYDPILAALTGNGVVGGDWLECDQVTKSIANTWNTPPPNSFTAEQAIKDESSKIADAYEKNLAKLILEILQMFFFNMLWAKYLVDLAIINPTRVMVGYPMDGIICFFKNMKSKCGEDYGRFRIKKKDCLKQYGPINKIINKLRCFLLCVPPKVLWDLKKYKPMVEDFNCNCEDYGPCPEDTRTNVSEDDKVPSGMESSMDAVFPQDEEPCTNEDDIIGEADRGKPKGIGLPPQCVKNAQVVIEAVIADALSPMDSTSVGLTTAGLQVTNQTNTL